ncbi:MAG: esterase-like activity of phytase family protein [Pseudoclavibacter sp.]
MIRPLSRTLAAGALAAILAASAAAAPAAAAPESLFTRTATYPVYLNAPEDVDPADETVAEISTVTDDGNTLIYTDAAGKRIGFLDISDPSNPQGQGTVALDELGNADDQPTSVAAYGDYVFVVIDETGDQFTDPHGRVDVLRIDDRSVVTSIDLAGQPDSIAISPDGAHAAIAMENQRDEEFTPPGGEEGDLPQAPSGFVQVLDLAGAAETWSATPVELPAEQLAGLDTPEDAEPEYVTINSRNEAAVTLQENNGVVIIDLATRAITGAFSAGVVDLDGVDATDDGVISPTDSLAGVPRVPDAIAWIGDDYLATANEGDWKGGSRGWTVFDAEGNVVWDAGTSFENLATQHGLHNEGRADNKGAEPEGLAVAEFDGVPYAFVASERSNFVAVYDVSDPVSPAFVQTLFTTNGPEGILPIPSRGILAVSSEEDDAEAGVRSAVNLFQLGAGEPQPTIISDEVDGAPIGWTALGALSADPSDPATLYSASDAALAQGFVYTIDASSEPARITASLPVTEDGAPAAVDIEGLHARAHGGFWLALEGATGPENAIARIDDTGAIVERISLPDDVSSHMRNWGLEGVAATTDDAGDEVVYVALQRPLWVDPSVGAGEVEPLEGENTTRIGRYDVASGEWSWLGYELESTEAPGDWMGLSEIVAVDDDTLAVIERDKLNGPNAAIKRVYTVEVPSGDALAAAGGSVIPVEKTLAYDALPDLQSFNGWTQEKLEGLTIGADGQVYAVTDNDGLDDATGETQFLRLGAAADIFGVDPAPTTPAPTEPGATEPGATEPGASEPGATEPSADGGDNGLNQTGGDLTWVILLVAGGLLAAGGLTMVALRRRNA